MDDVAATLRARLAHSGLRLGTVAMEMGLDEPSVSRYLHGRRAMPPDFPERFDAALRAVARTRAEHLLSVAGEEVA